ncbi:unnamed protein product [Amoebophrya sp. A25]|nr:unnamed protein product [Amoebophrya sp. A25]|eukprot:GSA25T00014460001.1
MVVSNSLSLAREDSRPSWHSGIGGGDVPRGSQHHQIGGGPILLAGGVDSSTQHTVINTAASGGGSHRSQVVIGGGAQVQHGGQVRSTTTRTTAGMIPVVGASNSSDKMDAGTTSAVYASVPADRSASASLVRLSRGVSGTATGGRLLLTRFYNYTLSRNAADDVETPLGQMKEEERRRSWFRNARRQTRLRENIMARYQMIQERLLLFGTSARTSIHQPAENEAAEGTNGTAKDNFIPNGGTKGGEPGAANANNTNSVGSGATTSMVVDGGGQQHQHQVTSTSDTTTSNHGAGLHAGEVILEEDFPKYQLLEDLQEGEQVHVIQQGGTSSASIASSAHLSTNVASSTARQFNSAGEGGFFLVNAPSTRNGGTSGVNVHNLRIATSEVSLNGLQGASGTSLSPPQPPHTPKRTQTQQGRLLRGLVTPSRQTVVEVDQTTGELVALAARPPRSIQRTTSHTIGTGQSPEQDLFHPVGNMEDHAVQGHQHAQNVALSRSRSRRSMQHSPSHTRLAARDTSAGDLLLRSSSVGSRLSSVGRPGSPQLGLPAQQQDFYMKVEEQPQSPAGVLHVFNACAITITGDVLAVILKSRKLRRFFFRIALQNCSVIIACRVSPIQKANIVELSRKYRQSEHNAMLAIGDGANDVGMIIKAHVGVGIAGKEGAQAAKSADFAIGQFKHLKKLCFVYGRESMRRNALFMYYMLNKNVAIALPSVFFSAVSRFSSTDLYDPWVKQIYNTVFTFLPIVLYALFDRELPFYYLMSGPPLYRPHRFGVPSIGDWAFWYWFAVGVWVAFACAIIPLCLFDEAPELAGTPAGYHCGTLVFAAVIVAVTALLPIHSHMYHWFTVPSMVGGFIVFLWTWVLMSETNFIGYSSTMYRTYWLLTWEVGEQFFLILFITTFCAILPHYVYMFRGVFFPDGVRIVKERTKLGVHDVLLLPDATNKSAGNIVVPHKRIQKRMMKG